MVDFKRMVEYGELLSRGYTEARSRLVQSLLEKEKIISIIESQTSIHSDYSLRLADIVSKEIILIERVNRWIEKSDQNTALQILTNNIKEIKKLGLDVDIDKIIRMNVDEKKLLLEFYENLKLQLIILEKDKQSNSSNFLKEYILLVKDEKKLFEKFVYGDRQAKTILAKLPRCNFLKIAAAFAIFIATAGYTEAASPTLKYHDPAGQNPFNLALEKASGRSLIPMNTNSTVKSNSSSTNPAAQNSSQKTGSVEKLNLSPLDPAVQNSLQKMNDNSNTMHVGVYALSVLCLGIAAYVAFEKVRAGKAEKSDSEFIDKFKKEF